MTDGVASLLGNVLPVGAVKVPEPIIEGWMPYRTMFDVAWSRSCTLPLSRTESSCPSHSSGVG